MRHLTTTIIGCLLAGAVTARTEPKMESELIFPLHPKHNHAPGIVETPTGDLITSWYRGSGERSADDVAVFGARRRKGESTWSEPFLMVDTPGFPDGNTCMWIDPKNRLWLFWPVVIANTWESVITHYLVSSDYAADGSPKWDRLGNILLKPEKFEEQMQAALEEEKKTFPIIDKLMQTKEFQEAAAKAKDKLYQRLGWQTRCKPTRLSTGRILLPLYSDTFSAGIMAISDDEGMTWFASSPLIGFGNIQPVVLERKDQSLIAYMRENGPRGKIRISESKDHGSTWGPVTNSTLPNPGAGVDAVALANGHWAIIYNDLRMGRHRLAVSISQDEGKTWPATRHLENQIPGSFHYPCIIQGKDGTMHAVYTYSIPGGESMKHAAFNEEWVLQGDPPKPDDKKDPSTNDEK
jgi:predicted neuraminidase